MKFKSLLLGTGAALAVAGGAQAADLAVAVEPIDYVKVCDAFGVGYWYIPGTDTCLKVGGYVEFKTVFYDTDSVGNIYGLGIPGDETSDFFGNFDVHVLKDSYAQSWEFKTEAGVNFNSRAMSDLGVIAVSMNFVTNSNNNGGSVGEEDIFKAVRFDGGYGAIGPLMFGWTASTFDAGGGYTYDGAIRSDVKTDQVRLSYMMGTWGIMLGLEDPRDRYTGPKNATGDYPDIVLAVTGGVGGFDLRAAAAVTDRTSGTGWGAQLTATAKLGVVDIKGNVAYSDNAFSLTMRDPSNCGDTTNGGICDDGEWWSAFLSGAVALSGNLKVAATVSGLWGQGGASYVQNDKIEAALGLYYYPTARSEIGAELLYQDPEGSDDSFQGTLKFKTHFN
jgi:hypothetical protein